MAKLLAIDGLNIVRRIYEANPEPDSPEKAETALRFSLSAFHKLHHEHTPSHIVAAFDFGGTTWRHALYDKYREQRAPMPDALRQSLPTLYAELEKFGIKVLCIPEVEADDVIGTVVLRWLAEGRGEAIVVSTDKDLHVLIAHGALIWDHFKNEWHDSAWVQNKFGVPPEQLEQLLALMGDPTDGIPGVTKVGMKTAAKLLQAYGSIDAIMAGAGILKNTVGENLRKDAKILALSRQLVVLKSDVQLGVTWKMLAMPTDGQHERF
ncbi:5'-3' exonuclease [Solimicrobium silvestre]|uniref:5'-3' exonuclease (Including N-terminal domain of PolI) n=1 Tax=Solimicrobium silvestre TaxID=2099400 RepID=A0A2S9H2B8_9BURK|nr:5'-3' exonuclease H3TH domain-containing protein [Solimicrobium silvestre]PRC94108.1 5'-3' exonuclease (including N-terminal domain of PolI) [Solimicrobium silvestre]